MGEPSKWRDFGPGKADLTQMQSSDYRDQRTDLPAQGEAGSARKRRRIEKRKQEYEERKRRRQLQAENSTSLPSGDGNKADQSSQRPDKATDKYKGEPCSKCVKMKDQLAGRPDKVNHLVKPHVNPNNHSVAECRLPASKVQAFIDTDEEARTGVNKRKNDKTNNNKPSAAGGKGGKPADNKNLKKTNE